MEQAKALQSEKVTRANEDRAGNIPLRKDTAKQLAQAENSRKKIQHALTLRKTQAAIRSAKRQLLMEQQKVQTLQQQVQDTTTEMEQQILGRQIEEQQLADERFTITAPTSRRWLPSVGTKISSTR